MCLFYITSSTILGDKKVIQRSYVRKLEGTANNHVKVESGGT